MHLHRIANNALKALSALMVAVFMAGCSTKQGGAGAQADTAEQVEEDAEQLMDALDPNVDCSTLFREIQLHPKLLTAKARQGPWDIELRFRPAVCRACAEQMAAQLKDTGLQQRRAELASTELYVLRMRTKTPDQEAPTEEQLLSGIVQVIGNDTLPAVFLHKEAITSSSPYSSYLIGFDLPEHDGARAVIIRGIGEQAIRLELSNERLGAFIHLGQEQV